MRHGRARSRGYARAGLRAEERDGSGDGRAGSPPAEMGGQGSPGRGRAGGVAASRLRRSERTAAASGRPGGTRPDRGGALVGPVPPRTGTHGGGRAGRRRPRRRHHPLRGREPDLGGLRLAAAVVSRGLERPLRPAQHGPAARTGQGVPHTAAAAPLPPAQPAFRRRQGREVLPEGEGRGAGRPGRPARPGPPPGRHCPGQGRRGRRSRPPGRRGRRRYAGDGRRRRGGTRPPVPRHLGRHTQPLRHGPGPGPGRPVHLPRRPHGRGRTPRRPRLRRRPPLRQQRVVRRLRGRRPEPRLSR
ncbi:hypothetical protein SPURM210S_08164 [Streptomyces purpurascens]